mgnify:CR=1 FL=1
MLEMNQLKALANAAAEANRSVATCYSVNGENLSVSAINDTLRDQFNEIAGTYNLYRENKTKVYSLVETLLDDILPTKVLQRYADFAETQTFAQGTKPVFIRKTGKMRAKQFITKVGLAGRYEVFALGEKSFEVATSAIGGAAAIGFEEFLDGRVDWAELVNIVLEGMDELILREIAKALMASIEQLPAANRVSAAGFDENGMDRLISVVSAYGTPVIYCTREFATKMVPQAGWISDSMRDERWANGFLANYKGVRVVLLPQSFEDETNATKVIDPGYAWIMPTGSSEKPVKIAFEGSAHMREVENDDWSREMQVYQKVGVGVMFTNNMASYVDTDLKGKLSTI